MGRKKKVIPPAPDANLQHRRLLWLRRMYESSSLHPLCETVVLRLCTRWGIDAQKVLPI